MEIERSNSQSKRHGEFFENTDTQDIEDSLYDALTLPRRKVPRKPQLDYLSMYTKAVVSDKYIY